MIAVPSRLTGVPLLWVNSQRSVAAWLAMLGKLLVTPRYSNMLVTLACFGGLAIKLE